MIPTPTEVPPSPDPELSIVWSDDFEDGDFADWEEVGSTGFYYVNEGVLTVGPDSAGDIVHRSDVAHGTWSFDVFISDQMMSQNEIGVTCDEDYIYCWSMVIRAKQKTVIDVTRVENGVESKVAEFQSEGHNRGAQRG